MSRYTRKDRTALTYDANKKRIRHELGLLLAEIQNEVLAEMTADFDQAIQNKELLMLGLTREQAVAYLRSAMRRLYGAVPE